MRRTHKPNEERTSRPAFHTDLLSVAIAVLASSSYAVLTYYAEDQATRNALNTLTTGIVISVLTASCALLLNLNRRVSREGHEFNEMSIEISQLLQLHRSVIRNRERLENLESSFLDREPLVQATGKDCLAAYLNEFKPIKHGFQIMGQGWALRSYEYFWKHLVEEQEGRQKSGGKNGIECVMTHSSPIDLWKGYSQSTYLRSLQQKFCSAGGRMLRVFIYSDAEPTRECVETMADMNDEGIATKYLQANDLQLTYDFLWVQNMSYVVKWTMCANVGGRIDSCEILDRVDDKVKENWELITAGLERAGTAGVV